MTPDERVDAADKELDALASDISELKVRLVAIAKQVRFHSTSITDQQDQCLSKTFAKLFEEYAQLPCLGWRHTGPDDPIEYVTYRQVFSESQGLAKALARTFKPGTNIAICGSNCYEWFVADLACLWAGCVSIPLCDLWDLKVRNSVIATTATCAIICEPRLLSTMICTANESPTVSMVLSWAGVDDHPNPLRTNSWNARLSATPRSDLAVVTVHELVREHGLSSAAPLIVEREPDATHTILHTSGTTGLPKGVLYSDRLWLANMASYPGENAGFSYMPLAYITDRHTVYTSLFNGGTVGILTGTAPENKTEQIFRDLADVQPTVRVLHPLRFL